VRGTLAIAISMVLAACGCGDAAGLSDAGRHARVIEMADGYTHAWPHLPRVDAAALRAGALDNPMLVDCRKTSEQAVSRLPGAVVRDDFEAQRDADPQRFAGRPVVIYCTIGYRSGRYAAALRKQGIDAYNLHGGVLDWAHDGGAFLTPEGADTRDVHVYGRQWSLLPADYDATY